jgi:hypothetical protein
MGYFDGGFTVSDVFQNQLSETWTTQQYFFPYFKHDVLLITGYPSTTTFISDASVNQFNLNVFGDTRVTKINPYLGSNYSVYFDGTGDYLFINSNSPLPTSSTSWTIEGYYYFNSIAATIGLVGFSDLFNMYISSTGTAFLFKVMCDHRVFVTMCSINDLMRSISWRQICVVLDTFSLANTMQM